MANIYDIVKPSEIKVYWDSTKETRKPYLGEILFPKIKQLGLDLSFLKGAGGLPIVLKASAFDVETPLRDRIGIQELNYEIPFFKEGFLIKERDRQALNTALNNGQLEVAKVLAENVFNDTNSLINGARVREEMMRMQLLSTGKIAVNHKNEDLEYDYYLADDQKVTLTDTDKWDNPDADILGDIETWVELMTSKGKMVDKILMTSKTFNSIKKNKGIKEYVTTVPGIVPRVNNDIVKDIFDNEFGLTVVLYDEKYVDEKGEDKKFFPDGVVTLLPSGTIGKTVNGTTPEESDLMSGATNAEVAIVETGVAVTTDKRTDPVNVFTKASVLTLPSAENIDSIFIATVA